jgi:hypothetical protein
MTGGLLLWQTIFKAISMLSGVLKACCIWRGEMPILFVDIVF